MNRTHGHAKPFRSPEYSVWLGMLARCTRPSVRGYARYGGAGVRVCGAWTASFVAFLKDMGPRPPGSTLDRLDNTKGYEPGNCRWASAKVQQRNKRDNRLVTAKGRTQCHAAWVEETGLRSSTLWNRLARGWSPEKALFTPARAKRGANV